MTRTIRLFIDFDGTITRDDVGDVLFQTFGAFEPIHSELLAGKHTVASYYRHATKLLRNDATPETIREFALRREVDPYVVSLFTWCEANGVDITVVSDGFDVYIEPILSLIGYGHLRRYSNALSWHEGTWEPSFPGASESCSCFCASCKRNVLLTLSGPDDVIIYVGDGRSDTCAAEHADIVFAKGTLAKHCETHGVAHHHFHTMFQVQQILERRLHDDDLRPRKQAERLRQRAIQGE
jgi:2,3-diketo-5-methylthio-1-phosphopentane phosphatase